LKFRDYFGKSTDEWDWENFISTEDFPISENLMDWVIGQDKALEECKLCLDEWIHKLKYLKKRKWWKFWEKPEAIKPSAKDQLPAGPYLLLLGDAGTGKSLIGKALASHLTYLYKKHNISLYDVICWKNEVIPSEPRISIQPSPKGKELVYELKKKEARKGFLKRFLMKAGSIVFAAGGSFLTFCGLYILLEPWISNPYFSVGGIPTSLQEYYRGNFFKYIMNNITNVFPLFMAGSSMVLAAVFIHFFGRFFSGNLTGTQGIGGAEITNAPKLIVDNSECEAPFVDATGHGSSQLFGSIAWDPYQTGGLGTPEHQRVSAGDVHRAFMGVLYIDEVKNLKPVEAVTLLTVLEDGQLPIALRSTSGFHGGETAAMAVSTEPVPCMTFLVAAGNMDSVPLIHPALMDRITGYGKVVYMNNDMPNTPENRRKCVQFIAQEVKRFNLIPFSREACIEIIEESRRKSGRKDRLTTRFRPLISIIKTASVLAMNEGKKIVEAKHVKEAIKEHCKTVERQVLEKIAKYSDEYKVVDPNAKPRIGQIYGLGVTWAETSEERIGAVLPIKASIIQLRKKEEGSFTVTGINTDEKSWMHHSIQKVSNVLNQLYQFKNPLRIHIDFAQEIGVDGPSAGMAMILALASIVEGKPIRQDIAVTGEINIAIASNFGKGNWKPDEVIATPVGGIHEKILAAQRMGFKKVLVPKRNYELNVNPKDYKIEIVPCATLAEYMREMFCERK